MQKKLIWIILTLLLAIAAYVTFNQQASTIKSERSDFSIKDTANVTKVFMVNDDGKSVTLTRQETDWMVNEKHKVRPDAIQLLLETLYKQKVRTPVPTKAFETVVKNIATEHVKVEVYLNGEARPEKVFYVGNANPLHNGSYMLIDGSTVPFVVHIEGFKGYLTPRYFVEEHEWRSKSIFNSSIDEIAEVKVEWPKQLFNSFKISRSDGTIKLTALGAETAIDRVDTLGLYQYLANYQSINFESILPKADINFIDSLIKATPEQIYTLTTVNGEQQKVAVYKKKMPEGSTGYNEEPLYYDLDRMYGIVNEKDLVIVQYFVFDRLKKELGYFRN